MTANHESLTHCLISAETRFDLVPVQCLSVVFGGSVYSNQTKTEEQRYGKCVCKSGRRINRCVCCILLP